MRKRICSVLILLSFLVVGLFAGCSAGKVSKPSGSGNVAGSAGTGSYISMLVKKVDSMPEIDGSPDDPQWKEAIGISSHNTTLKSIYTDDEIAFLYTVEDPTMSIVTPDCWYYDGNKFVRWREYREEKDDPIYRSWEMYNMAWETSDFDLEKGGCLNMCHTDDSGKSRHVVPEGASADLWCLFCKHGYGGDSVYETGFNLGYLGTYQEGPVSFVQSDTKDPFQVTSGTFGFIGWADERIQTSWDNPDFAGTANKTETGQYCLQCHTTEFVEGSPLQGKPGKMPYRRNAEEISNMFATAPEYIKTYPRDFADAMVITDKDIIEGSAVKVSSLSKDEIKKAWSRYEELNCLVPELILQEPTGNMAQTKIGARWSDGIWTVEIKRNRTTDNPHDIQFDDLSKNYTLSTAVSFGIEGGRAGGAFGSDIGIRVMFEDVKPQEN